MCQVAPPFTRGALTEPFHSGTIRRERTFGLHPALEADMMRTGHPRKSRPSAKRNELWRFQSRAGVEVRATLSPLSTGLELNWYVANRLSGTRCFPSRDSALECADRMRMGLLAEENMHAIAAATGSSTLLP
jgi:hypothetical protein